MRMETTAMQLKILQLVVLASLARQSATDSEETDCRELSGYETGPAPKTCTVQLTLNDTEADIISSLGEKYRELPLRCRYGKAHTSAS